MRKGRQSRAAAPFVNCFRRFSEVLFQFKWTEFKQWMTSTSVAQAYCVTLTSANGFSLRVIVWFAQSQSVSLCLEMLHPWAPFLLLSSDANIVFSFSFSSSFSFPSWILSFYINHSQMIVNGSGGREQVHSDAARRPHGDQIHSRVWQRRDSRHLHRQRRPVLSRVQASAWVKETGKKRKWFINRRRDHLDQIRSTHQPLSQLSRARFSSTHVHQQLLSTFHFNINVSFYAFLIYTHSLSCTLLYRIYYEDWLSTLALSHTLSHLLSLFLMMINTFSTTIYSLTHLLLLSLTFYSTPFQDFAFFSTLWASN